MMDIEEFIIGRAFALPGGSTHPAKLAGCDNPGPPTRTIILAIRIRCELWCRPLRHEPKVLRGGQRIMLAADLQFRAQNTSPKSRDQRWSIERSLFGAGHSTGGVRK